MISGSKENFDEGRLREKIDGHREGRHAYLSGSAADVVTSAAASGRILVIETVA